MLKRNFILAFYMLHEVPDQNATLSELKTLLKPEGKILIAEPKAHVPKSNFEATEKRALRHGFHIIERPEVFFSRAFLAEKEGHSAE